MRKPMTMIGLRRVLLVTIAGALGIAWGCGGGSSSPRGLCDQGCDKAAACGSTDAASCKSLCALADAIIASCKNVDALISQARSCLAMDCASFAVCMDNQPKCQLDVTGSGGSSSSSGGRSGSGGGAGTGG